MYILQGFLLIQTATRIAYVLLLFVIICACNCFIVLFDYNFLDANKVGSESKEEGC